MSKTVSIVKWFEAYEYHTYQFIVQENSQLTCIIRNNFAVSTVVPTLAIGQPHSIYHESVKLEMMHRLPHSHNIYTEDNMTVYRHIFKENLGTQYTTTISTFKRARNGRGAYLALKYQSAVPACWYQEVKDTTNFLVNRKFTGNTGLSLQEFLNQHRE